MEMAVHKMEDLEQRLVHNLSLNQAPNIEAQAASEHLPISCDNEGIERLGKERRQKGNRARMSDENRYRETILYLRLEDLTLLAG